MGKNYFDKNAPPLRFGSYPKHRKRYFFQASQPDWFSRSTGSSEAEPFSNYQRCHFREQTPFEVYSNEPSDLLPLCCIFHTARAPDGWEETMIAEHLDSMASPNPQQEGTWPRPPAGSTAALHEEPRPAQALIDRECLNMEAGDQQAADTPPQLPISTTSAPPPPPIPRPSMGIGAGLADTGQDDNAARTELAARAELAAPITAQPVGSDTLPHTQATRDVPASAEVEHLPMPFSSEVTNILTNIPVVPLAGQLSYSLAQLNGIPNLLSSSAQSSTNTLTSTSSSSALPASSNPPPAQSIGLSFGPFYDQKLNSTSRSNSEEEGERGSGDATKDAEQDAYTPPHPAPTDQSTTNAVRRKQTTTNDVRRNQTTTNAVPGDQTATNYQSANQTATHYQSANQTTTNAAPGKQSATNAVPINQTTANAASDAPSTKHSAPVLPTSAPATSPPQHFTPPT